MMTSQRQAAFKDAKEKASDLMSSLYQLRSLFTENGMSSKDSGDVWREIPSAQSLIHVIENHIAKAESSVSKMSLNDSRVACIHAMVRCDACTEAIRAATET